ncbi:MAG: hypothetical protein HY320_03015 [Armatimonadetes bacterium]|nr:hypothetical protein [Armatimonadota bacterium]
MIRRPRDRRARSPAVNLLVALVGIICFTAAPAHAQTTLTFSGFSSDATSPSVLTGQVTFHVVGSQLNISINNTSAFKVAQLYFNSDTALTGLAFAGSVNAAWSIAGGGASQTKQADGFGKYNWQIDFGSGDNRLAAGSVTALTLNMTGTTLESTIGNKLSTIPPGSIQAIGVLKFEAGPGDDSAFGATNQPGVPSNPPVTPVVPEGPGGLLLIAGILPLLGIAVLARRRGPPVGRRTG